MDEITQYLPRRYQRRGVQLPAGLYSNPGGMLRSDDTPRDSGKPGSTIENVQEYLLDKYNIDYGILTGDVLTLSTIPNRDYAAELPVHITNGRLINGFRAMMLGY
jgi:hypothetical protein